MIILRKGIQWTAGILTAILVLTVGAYCVLRYGFEIDLLDRSGWQEEAGLRQYLDYHGEPLVSWQTIDGQTYYFDPDAQGKMVTGWLKLDGKDYFLGADGKRCTGWVDTDKGRYYLEKDGAALYGWHTDQEGTYYLTQDSGMVTGWLEENGKRYHFNSSGLLQTGWLALQEGQYYLDETGAAVIGCVELSESTYYFDETGVMQTGWLDTENGRLYFTEAGHMVRGFHETDVGNCYFDADGILQTGWATIEGNAYYFEANGAMQTGWVDVEENRYYFNDNGIMQTGWLELDGEQYYLQEDGSMAIGEVKIDGVSNFFTSQGKYVIMVNPWHLMPEDYELNMETIEGYEFDVVGKAALQKMLNDCRAAGYNCTINNTYRSVATQQYMWDVRIEQRMAEGMTYDEAITFIGQSLAKVGASEHHLGLAVDLDGSDAMEAWMAEHCWDYGFILRYPQGKTGVTGIIYEPWHFRYVGTELALELKELRLCMEEYMAMLTEKAKS